MFWVQKKKGSGEGGGGNLRGTVLLNAACF